MKGRILAIDYGTKRVGIAMTDPMRIFAKAHSVLKNSGFESLVKEILNLVQEYQVTLIVVGMPYAIDGGLTPKTIETKEFQEKLQERTKIPVVSCDERYSSSEAEEELKMMGKSWQESRKLVDAMAAAMILKTYLETYEQ